MTKKKINVNRKEAYQFYKSLGNSVKKATNMRNRSAARIIKDYERERKKANKKLEDKVVYKHIKIHRPRVYSKPSEIKTFRNKIKSLGVSHKVAVLMGKDNAINQHLYVKRVRGLKGFFENKTEMSWQELMEHMETFSNLSDWFDFIGELYEDNK